MKSVSVIVAHTHSVSIISKVDYVCGYRNDNISTNVSYIIEICLFFNNKY